MISGIIKKHPDPEAFTCSEAKTNKHFTHLSIFLTHNSPRKSVLFNYNFRLSDAKTEALLPVLTSSEWTRPLSGL